MKWLEFFTPPSTRSPLFVTAIKASLMTGLFLGYGVLSDQLVAMSAMSMGMTAAALTDHPAHYHRRFRALVTLLLCFGLSSSAIVLLYAHPLGFVVSFCAACFGLMMASALGPRFGKMTFGALTIAVFTMLSYPHHTQPQWLPALQLTGAFCYFVVSTLVQRLLPNFNLDHDNQQLYATLAKYQLLKARFFDANSDPVAIRLQLAKLSAQATQSSANVRQQLILRQQQQTTANHGTGYLEQFFKAQVLLERLSSSHILYQALRLELADTSLPARIQRVMIGLSKRMLRQPRSRRIANYTMDDSVEQDIHQLERSTQRLAERGVFSRSCAIQLGFLLKNLKKVCELTQTETPFPSPHFLFSEQRALGWRHYWSLLTTPNTAIFRHSARLSVCMLIGYGIIQLMPADSQNYWLLLTILFITRPTFSATKLRLSQRVIGTVLGIGLATILYWLNLPVWVLVAIAASTKFFFFWYLEQRYSIAVACVSIYVAIILQFYGLDAEAVFLKRIVITTMAAGLVFLALRFLWPDWLKKRSRSVVAISLKTIKNYQQAVFDQYLGKDCSEDESYRSARFHAHLSEANLVEHWQALLAEPRSKQLEASTLYLLTGRLHAYLSHLSALASHRGRITSATALPLIEQIGEKLTEQLVELEQTLLQPQLNSPTPCHYSDIEERLSALTPTLSGEDLMVTFQLLRLNGNLAQINALIRAEQDWQQASSE